MPVIDHPVSEMTKRTDSDPYGCSNKEKKDGYYALDREYLPDGKFSLKLRYVEHVMSKMCRYDKRNEDKRCSQCSRVSDIDYLEKYGLCTLPTKANMSPDAHVHTRNNTESVTHNV